MKRYFLLMAAALTLAACGGRATTNEIVKETFVYSVKGEDTLYLDKYDLRDSHTGDRPCVIFMFGGGFVGGQRGGEGHEAYMKQLVGTGCVAVSIDYRLGMKGVSEMEGLTMEDVSGMLGKSIYMAVEDLYSATSFVCDKAGEWSVDKELIITNGSSAGAIAVLQAEYFSRNPGEIPVLLPEGFNYAGVIAFAGCVMSQGEPKWAERPAPIMMFHGDADSNVPFDKVELMGWGLYGSHFLAGQFQAMESPYYLYTVENAAHEVCWNPMQENLGEIGTFIDKLVVDKLPLMVNTTVDQIGRPTVNKNFTFKDYLEKNYSKH